MSFTRVSDVIALGLSAPVIVTESPVVKPWAPAVTAVTVLPVKDSEATAIESENSVDTLGRTAANCKITSDAFTYRFVYLRCWYRCYVQVNSMDKFIA